MQSTHASAFKERMRLKLHELGIRYAASTIRLLGRLTSGELCFAFATRNESLASKEQMLKRLASKKQMRHLACKERMLKQMLKRMHKELREGRGRCELAFRVPE